MRDKKGLSGQITTIIVMGIILGVIMLMVFVAQLAGPILFGPLQEIGVEINTAFQETGNQDLIDAQESSFQPAIQATNNFEWITYTILIFMFIIFIVMCFYVRTYPFLIVVWILMILLLLFASLYLTVSYQEISVDSTLSGYYDSWENSNFLLKNLPVIILMVGVIGGIIMFILASREQEAEVGGSYQL